jgi:hypothetical protein
MLAVLSTMVLMSLSFPVNARFMPLVVGIPGIALCLLQLVLDLRAARRVRTAAPSVPQEGDGDEFGRHTLRMEVVSWLYFLLFIGGVLLFGFLIAAPVLVAMYLRREAGVRWPRALIAAGIMAAMLHLLFQQALGFRLFEGFVGGEILDALNL